MESTQSPSWREEKVFLVFVPHTSGLRALRDKPVGDWRVEPALKPAYRGQTITWKTVPDAELELFLPDVFETDHVKATGKVSVRVKKDGVASGLYLYEAYCNGQLATGGSSPGMIIDP
jgi:hypothetical protein